MGALATKLAAFYDSMLDRVGPANAAVLHRTLAELRASGIGANAVRVGAPAPDFALPDQGGRQHRLCDELRAGPVVVLFYRGGWSPLCELTLREWQDAEDAVRAAGARLLAVSPDDRETSESTARDNWISFPLLADTEHRVAAAYGLDFEMPREAARLYAKFNARVGKRCCAWRLPIAATYVIAPDGLVRAAHIDVCPFARMEPTEAVTVLRAMPRATLTPDLSRTDEIATAG
jgi:peroxiredoxin